MTRRKRRPRPAVAPMLVVAQVTNIETAERIRVRAIIDGWATVEMFDDLANCCDLLLIGGTEKRDDSALAAGEIARVALLNIKDRYFAVGKFECCGDEPAALELLAQTSSDFWKRQSAVYFHEAFIKMQKMRRIEQAQRAADTQETTLAVPQATIQT